MAATPRRASSVWNLCCRCDVSQGSLVNGSPFCAGWMHNRFQRTLRPVFQGNRMNVMAVADWIRYQYISSLAPMRNASVMLSALPGRTPLRRSSRHRVQTHTFTTVSAQLKWYRRAKPGWLNLQGPEPTKRG